MSAKEKTSETERLKTNEQKWSKPLMEAGWTAIPSVILDRQKALGLEPVDVNIIMHLAVYWWTADNKPHPSKATIAEAMGMHPRSIQRRIERLEKAGFIRREQRRIPGKGSKTNLYHLDGLIDACAPFAQEKIKEVAEKTAAKAERLKRKRPTLVVNNEEDDEG